MMKYVLESARRGRERETITCDDMMASTDISSSHYTVSYWCSEEKGCWVEKVWIVREDLRGWLFGSDAVVSYVALRWVKIDAEEDAEVEVDRES